MPDAFALDDSETLSAGLQRLTVGQFDRAIELLGTGTDVDAAVHSARKSMKRLRAILRLVRSEIGDTVYRAENGILRDTARLMAPMRDGQVMAAAVGGLREDFDGQLAPDALSGLEDALWQRHQTRRRRVLEDESVFPVVVGTLRSARARYSAWPIETAGIATTDPYGRRPIADRYESIAPGLARTYGRGRDEMDLAAREPTPHHFHQWRKRVKYLRHQVEVLDPLWPEMMSTYARTLDHLGEVLGEEHDLAVLVELLATDRSLHVDRAELAVASVALRLCRCAGSSLVDSECVSSPPRSPQEWFCPPGGLPTWIGTRPRRSGRAKVVRPSPP